MRAASVATGCLTVAALSLLGPAAPGYDPWSWLIWGREVGQLALDTREGPAWKPLPVLIATPLGFLGDAAPEAWLVVARAGALLGAVEAGRLAARFTGGSRTAALVAGSGVVLCGGWVAHAGAGDAEGLLLGLALVAFRLALDGRHGLALALGVAAALVRTETWPFVLVYGLVLWRGRPALRSSLAVGAIAVVALWFVPELWGSGDLLRSSERARVANPGAPALAERPVLASLGDAARLPLAPVLGGVVAAAVLAARGRVARAALVPAAAGLAWIGLVAAMSELGFAGEARYHLPGAAALAVTGAVGLVGLLRAVRGQRAAAALVTMAALVAVGARVGAVSDEGRRLARDHRHTADLAAAVRAAGGASALRSCGPVYTGHYRGPIVAWHLAVPKRAVAFEPSAPGVVLRSQLTPDAPVTPAAPRLFQRWGRMGTWEVLALCTGEPASRARRALPQALPAPQPYWAR